MVLGLVQRTARQGGNPPLLIAADQEGGEVKRLSDGPPDLSLPQMVATHSVATATRAVRATGAYLKRWGINMDLAPVADVPTFAGAFIFTPAPGVLVHRRAGARSIAGR